VLWQVIAHRPLNTMDHEYALAEARRITERIPSALVSGLVYVGFIASSWSVFSPENVSGLIFLALLVVSVALYLGGLAFAIRVWLWLKRQS
jgi:hypothetical protein